MQDADKTDIYQLSRNWADLVKRARGKQLAPDEFNSGTFTISNMGMYGPDAFDAILPPGQMASTPALLGRTTSCRPSNGSRSSTRKSCRLVAN